MQLDFKPNIISLFQVSGFTISYFSGKFNKDFSFNLSINFKTHYNANNNTDMYFAGMAG
jgi:hypothetical protein